MSSGCALMYNTLHFTFYICIDMPIHLYTVLHGTRFFIDTLLYSSLLPLTCRLTLTHYVAHYVVLLGGAERELS